MSHNTHHRQEQAYSCIEPEAYSDDNNEHVIPMYRQINPYKPVLQYNIC